MNAGRGKRAAGHASSAEGPGRAAPAASPRAVDPRLFSLVVIVGYGLFRGVNANSYLSAFASVEAPFLFVPDLFFNVVVACSVVVCSVTVIALTLRGRLGPLSMPYVAPAALFVAANLCALFGVFSWMPSDLALIVPGVLLGVASVMLSLVWVEVLSCQEPRAIVAQIALSMLVNMVTSSVLSGLSGGARAVASCAALVVMVLCAWYVRRALRAGAAGTRAGGRRKDAPRGSYRDAFLELGDSLVAFCVMEAVIGLLNSFMLAGSVTFAGSGSVSGVGMLIGILAFCVVVFVVQRIPRVSTAFRVLMPIIASLLVFLPFLGEQFNLFFSTVLLGGYYFIALLITYVVAETAHVRNLSPYVLMGAAACLARVCLAAALLGGHAIGSLPGGLFGESEHIMRYLVVIMAVIYALSLAAVLVSRDRRRGRRGDADAGASAAVPAPAGAAEAAPLPAGAAAEGDDAFDARCAAVAAAGGLTEREAEIMRYLARGRTKAHIAGVLFVSENTVRSHVRNIYAKLEVHTRQQLIDLVEEERGADGGGEAPGCR
ncbi:LuxR family transcriptional regulator [Gordonibacter pamelaeae]|nr:LuxR family transcriptional regulator [Gordonibacter pamelaeae]